jgi:multisubunit Na+/H+ antiporter MnhE subunit
MGRIVTWLLWAMPLFLLWLALVGTLDELELYAGAVAAALGALALEAIRGRGLLPYRFERSWLARTWRPLVRVVTDFLLVARVALRALAGGDREPGALRTYPLPVDGDDPARAARRALVGAAGSLAPNQVVVDVDRERGAVLVHELDPSRSSGPPL